MTGIERLREIAKVFGGTSAPSWERVTRAEAREVVAHIDHLESRVLELHDAQVSSVAHIDAQDQRIRELEEAAGRMLGAYEATDHMSYWESRARLEDVARIEALLAPAEPESEVCSACRAVHPWPSLHGDIQ